MEQNTTLRPIPISRSRKPILRSPATGYCDIIYLRANKLWREMRTNHQRPLAAQGRLGYPETMSRSELAHLELLAEVDALVDRLRRWTESAPPWQPAEKCRALVRRLTERAASLRVRIEAPLVVATLGGSGTGKSALVNALGGSLVFRTGRRRPTTMRPTLVCRPGLTPEMLGIDPAGVELIQRDLPALGDLVLIDCPDPDTTEEENEGTAVDVGEFPAHASHPSSLSDNLARLRAILPKCDVLLVTATQQKYRSARVSAELAAAAPGATVVFVQTHAEQDDDIRDDWRRVLAGEIGLQQMRTPGAAAELSAVATQALALTLAQRERGPAETAHIYRVDSLRALADAQAGLQPRGEFADLLDLLTRQMAGTAANRIRRANLLDLAADALDACRRWIDPSLPRVRELQSAIDQQRAVLASQWADRMRAELLASRRQWENRLLGQTASRWGLSPFSLVLRAYQGVGGLLSGALLYRARTPAQMALWGALEGVRTWRGRSRQRDAERGVDRAAAAGFDPTELRKAAIIVQGYAADAELLDGPSGLSWAGKDACPTFLDQAAAEAESAAAGFVARAAGELQSLAARVAKQQSGWFARFFYETLLLAMLATLLYRLGKNFFYDSWLAQDPSPVYGLDFYLSAGFWLVLWCLILLWAFCRRLRRGLQSEIDRLAAGWRDAAAAGGVFARVDDACRDVERFCLELDVLRREIDALRRQVATSSSAER